ncbi:MAG: peptidyl-tRNA hydrolase Pth2 [Candidatus Micrarchaeota archaeon]|nr:peptidyl-tRNA hydrolase Pth2 [Candidatus Micrarchaeota archaeon]
MSLKQAIVIRSDLGMGKGKLAAQTSHASLSAYKKCERENPDDANAWEDEGQKKIVLKVGSEEELVALFEKMKKEIPCALIRDAGHTQVEPGSITCFGAGPADESKINKYCKDLKLL